MDLKMHIYSVPLRSPAPLGILRWGNASDQKLEVGGGTAFPPSPITL